MQRISLSRLALIFTACLIGGMSQATAQPALGNFPYVYLNNGDKADPQVWRTNVVPLWPDKICFGWTMAVEGRNRSVELTEVLTLSAPSTNWGHGPETVVENGNKATTKIKVDIVDNRLARAWCITDGDPPGQYRYNIYIDGQQRAEFIYCAVKVPDDGSVRVEDLKCPYKFDSVKLLLPFGVARPLPIIGNAALAVLVWQP